MDSRKNTTKVDMELAPMIDVCFQLLIFFMVTSKFKTLEGKLDAYCPKEGLENIPSEPPETLPVRVSLRWNPAIGKCKIYVGQVLCSYNEPGIERAFRLMLRLKQAGSTGAEIDAGEDVPMEWVVQALNMLVKADMTKITFTGSPALLELGGKS